MSASGQAPEQKRPLSNKQRAFVEYYLTCWNASEAARRAGYKSKANVIGSQLLAIPSIREAVEARLADLQMQADEILARFTEQARGSMADFVDVSAETIDLKKAEEAGKLHLLKSFSRSESNKTTTVRIELYDAQQALSNLARIRGLFVDKTALTDPTGTKEYASLTDDERLGRLAEILDALRARRDRPAVDDTPALDATD